MKLVRKANLVPKRVTVKGKNKTYTATRYVSNKGASSVSKVKQYESTIAHKDVEFGGLFIDGELKKEYDGYSTHISISTTDPENNGNVANAIFTHNHPIDNSGKYTKVVFPFSKNDISFFIRSGIKEIRAVNKKGHVFRAVRTSKTDKDFDNSDSMTYYTAGFYKYDDKLKNDPYYEGAPAAQRQAYAQHLFNKELATKGGFEYIVEGVKDKDFFNG